MWAEPTDVCGCISAHEMMPNLNKAALTNDFMELDESTDTAPPLQIEITEPMAVGEGMEDEDSEPPDTSVPTSVPSPVYSPPHEKPQHPSQMTIGPVRGLLVDGSQSLVSIRLPSCFTPRRSPLPRRYGV